MKLRILKPYILFALLSVLFTSCSSDSEEDNIEANDNFLNPNEASENIIIAGSNYIKAKIPSPNEKVSFKLLETNQFAIPLEGFDIPIETELPIIGAYIQFEHNDGTPASGYFDVNIKANQFGKISNGNVEKDINSNEQSTIDVDFNKNITPSKFCYSIYVYDAAKNISAPQRVCVEVGPLGGITELAKEWSFASRQEFYISDMAGTKTFKNGDELIRHRFTFDCDSGERITLEGVLIQDKNSLILNIDGTYSYENNDIDDEFDYETSKEQCKQISSKVVRTHKSSGVWSYQATTKRLVLIEYKRTLMKDKTITADFESEPGDGDIFRDVLVELKPKELKLFYGDGVSSDSVWWVYFTQ